MQRKNSPIFLGDLARAVCDLGIMDPATINLIAEMLGMSLEERSVVTQSLAHVSQQRKVDGIPKQETTDGEREESQLQSGSLDGSEHKSIPIDIEHFPSTNEEWIEEVEPLPPQIDGVIEPAPLIPLLMPQWTRGILSAALATNSEDGLPDLETVTEMLAGAESIQRIPTLRSRTLRRGLHLLVDKSQAMMPFFRDQTQLLKEIQQVTGVDKVEIFRFVGSPLRGATHGIKSRQPYKPPLPGTPVLLLTDLGICQPMLATDYADEQEWLEFSNMINRAGCPLLAMVPYKAARWPGALAKVINIIHWDRNTTATTVNNMIKRFQEAPLP